MPKVKSDPVLRGSGDNQRKRNRAVKESKTLAEGFSDKKFSELTGNDKDALLKVVALRLDLILPD
jgi:hypothetical protein